MSDKLSSLLLRPDLIRRRVWMGSQPVWVLKDPLSRQLCYLTDDEYELLNLADGSRSISQIGDQCKERFAPQHFSTESLVRFFADARKQDLLSIVGSQPHVKTQETSPKSNLNLLALRLPGINPDRFLDRYAWLVRPLFSPLAIVIFAILITVAAILVGIHFQSLTSDIVQATSRLNVGSGLIWLALVISVTKIAHEFAHAFACKVLGGECRELGVMLLVGVPCLYCDVSDAWLMDRRWKRVFVSAAGMLAELTLAAIATFVWLFTNDGIVQDLCVTVMLVCSVTTLVLNGNPLLRYDGYYILSDLSCTPNLAAEASGIIRRRVRRALWDLPEFSATISRENFRRRFLLALYGVASGMYRLLVYGFICVMLYRLAETYKIGAVVGALVAIMFGRVLYRMLASVLTPPPQALRSRSTRFVRLTALLLATVSVVAMFVLLPLPRSVVAPMSIQPTLAKTVFVTREGAIEDAMDFASVASSGDTIARLRNPRSERELVAIESRCEQLSRELKSLRTRRGSSLEVTARIPMLEKSLEDANEQRAIWQRHSQQLLPRSPSDGRVFSPSYRRHSSHLEQESRFWTGDPLDHENRGAWLQEGTVLAVVGDPIAREATLLMRQQEIELVRLDQSVSLLLPDYPRGTVRGRVIEIAVSPVAQVPEELSATQRVRGNDRDPLYRVRVQLEDMPTPLPVRLTGRAKIAVEPASMFQRLSCFLSDSFG